jgi:hypothetical protein
MSISYFLILAFHLWANFLVLLLYCRRRVRRALRPAVRDCPCSAATPTLRKMAWIIGILTVAHHHGL